ncbi:MAG: patatin-like phospholipase family protein [Gammaproteobacteria bacterium]
MKSNLLKPMRRTSSLLACSLLLTGCASYVLNQPLEKYDPNTGYRFPDAENISSHDDTNSDSLFICLAFSGGGTRAAAFAYGVLKKLSETTIVWEGKTRSLLDEVDCISGISGGSFTAAYYGLFGDRIFQDFRERFLDRDIQGELFRLAFNPLNWPRLASPKFNRIDLATELYDETLFDQKTFADLERQGKRPFIILNATNLASGERFEFTQEQFDFMGSDLGELPVARAVSASSAFPFLLSPVTLKNYPQPKEFTIPQSIESGLENYDYNRRFWHWAVRFNEYLDKNNRPFVHLMDGGLSDNIGMRAVENEFRRSGGFIRERINIGQKDPNSRNGIKKLVIIAANARTDNQDTISQNANPPDLAQVGFKTATISLDNYSFETIESMRDLIKQRKQTQKTWADCNQKLSRCPTPQPLVPLSREIEAVFIDLSFENLPDPEQRQELLNLPTSFSLPKEAVDHLIRAGGDLLENTPAFQSLKKEFQSGNQD